MNGGRRGLKRGALRAGFAGAVALLASCLLPSLLSGLLSGAPSIHAMDTALAKAPANGRAVRGSGLPLPRYVSLKADRINIRKGPGLDHRILWVFRRAGLPVEVVKEFQGWRQIRDAEGSVGWVLGAMLSGRRTALVLPWERKNNTRKYAGLHTNARVSSATLATVEAGVLVNIFICTGKWCEVTVGRLRGYIEQKNLWGIYPDEQVE